MNYESVSQIFEHLNKSRANLLGFVSSLDSAAADFRADADSWSTTEIVEHLSKTESGLVPVIFRLLKSAEAAGITSDGKLAKPISFERFGEAIKTQKFRAPEIIQPTENRSIEESLAKLSESRNTILVIRRRIEAVDSTATAFPHPFFGPMNLYEWLAFIGLHESRHLGQIKSVISKR